MTSSKLKKGEYLFTQMRTRVREADPALSRLLTIHFDKASIDVLEGAPTIFLSVHPGNDEIPTFRFGVPILRFDHISFRI